MKYKGKNLYLILNQKYDAGYVFLAEWKRSDGTNYVCITDDPAHYGKLYRIDDVTMEECPIVPVINERRAKKPLPFRKVPEELLVEDGEVDLKQIEEEARDYGSVYSAKAVFYFHQMFSYPGYGTSITGEEAPLELAAEARE